MAGQRNTYAFQISSSFIDTIIKKHILGVKKVVWDGLEVVWRWFGGGLGLTWQVNVIKMLLNFFFNY